VKISEFIWLKTIVDKIQQKHNVSQEEVREVFKNRPKFLFKEKGKVEGENLYNALGQTNSGRYLSVFFIYKKDRSALIISAREMTKSERRFYEKK